MMLRKYSIITYYNVFKMGNNKRSYFIFVMAIKSIIAKTTNIFLMIFYFRGGGGGMSIKSNNNILLRIVTKQGSVYV